MIRLGLQIPSFTYPGVPDDELFERVAAQAVAAEEAGFDSLFVMDHFYQLGGIGLPSDNMLEAYTLLSAVAARTSRIQLGALVTGVTYRHPAVLAKTVTTLDVVSRGRAILGIGAGWFEREHEAYGIRFPPAGERLDRLEEVLEICRAMFTQEQATFIGAHYRVRRAMNYPRPIRPDGIPVLVGGGGEKRTLRLVARYADACNLFGPPEVVRHKLDVLARHCKDVGRDPAEITKTRLGSLALGATRRDAEAALAAYVRERRLDAGIVSSMFLAAGPDEVAAHVERFREAGIEGFIFNMAHTSDPDQIRLAGSILRPLFE
jgi:F420-dependent oxidoreductase-like protein